MACNIAANPGNILYIGLNDIDAGQIVELCKTRIKTEWVIYGDRPGIRQCVDEDRGLAGCQRMADRLIKGVAASDVAKSFDR